MGTTRTIGLDAVSRGSSSARPLLWAVLLLVLVSSGHWIAGCQGELGGWEGMSVGYLLGVWPHSVSLVISHGIDQSDDK